MSFDVFDPEEDEAPSALYTPNRRNMLKWLGVAGVGGLAGCGGDGGATATETDTATPTEGNGGSAPTPTEGATATPKIATETPTPTLTPTPTPPADFPEITDTFTAAYSSAASTLNWFYNTEAGTAARIGLTLDGAWALAPGNQVFPLWLNPSTEDGKTYTITVRDGLQWGGDYGQMTAEDWVYMIKEVMKSDWAAYPNRSDFAGTTVEQTSDMEFTVTLSSKDPAWPLRPVLWGQFCAPKEIFQPYVEMAADGQTDQAQTQLEQDEALNNLTYTGNLGPYQMKKWEPEAQFVATRNDSYYMRERDDVPFLWQGAPYYQNYVQRVIPEQASRLQALKNDEVDTANIPPKRAQEFMDLDNVDVYVQPQPYVDQVTFNQRANGWKPFRDKNIRQAFMMAVDKKALAENVYRGYAKSAFTMQPEWSKWYSDANVTEFGEGDLLSARKARNKIREVASDWNLAYLDDQLVNTETGNQVKLTLIAQAGQPLEQTVAQLLKQYWEPLGVRIQIKAVQGRTFVRNYAYNSVPKGKQDQVPDDWPSSPFNAGPRDIATSNEPWDAALIYAFNTYPRTPSDSKGFFYERGGINFYGYVPSPGTNIKELYEQAASTVDEKKRQRLFARAFGQISREQPFGFLVMEDDIVGYEAGIQGPKETFASGWNTQTYHRGDGS